MSFFDEYTIRQAVVKGYDAFNQMADLAPSPYKNKGGWYLELDAAWSEGWSAAMYGQSLDETIKKVLNRHRNPR